MGRNETVTRDRVSQVLGGIEEATVNEELERRARGLTLEPEARVVVPDKPLDTKEVFSEGVPDQNDFARHWVAENPVNQYKFSVITPETQIFNDTELQIPSTLVDFFMKQSRELLDDNAEKKMRFLRLFHNIQFVSIIKDPRYECTILTNCPDGYTISHFNAAGQLCIIYYMPSF